ncbi:hypothetical protein [Planobispora longispora]|uniref:hypothetical protein n=1 Tax=Planobispora longispora TaxID=28887 RepID=UPI001941493D|nr:hypothetical protein [Planobispora longispora]
MGPPSGPAPAAGPATVLEIACDESGPEGEKLIGGNTDVFAHAGVGLTVGAAADCMREIRDRAPSPATEYKANILLRAKHRAALVWLLGPSGPIRGRAHVHLVDKTFFAVGKIADLLAGDVTCTADAGSCRTREAGALAVALYREGAAAFGRERWQAFLGAFNDLIRAVSRRRPPPAGRGLAALTLVDSRSDPRVQVADVLAGAARKIASDELGADAPPSPARPRGSVAFSSPRRSPLPGRDREPLKRPGTFPGARRYWLVDHSSGRRGGTVDDREAPGVGARGGGAPGGEVRGAEVLDSGAWGGGVFGGAGRPRRPRWAVWAVSSAVVLTVALTAVMVWPRLSGAGPAHDPSAAITAPARAVPSGSGPAGSATASPPATVIARQVAPGVRVGADRAGEGRLPRLATALPETLSTDGAVPLSAAPMTRALALFQRYGEGDLDRVFALDVDGGLRELDGVELTRPTDRHGNAHLPLNGTSLSPDGRRAAFPQRNEVVVADLTDGTSRRWPLPGFNEIVSWRPDGVTLVVEQEETVFLVDSRTGKAGRQPYPGFGTVAGGEPGTDLHRLRSASDLHRLGVTGPAKTELTRWDASGNLLARENPRLTVGTGEWWGSAWLRGGRVAGDVFGSGGRLEAEAVVVLDAVTGEQVAALKVPGMDRWKGCCQVMGWYDEDTVLFASRGGPSRLLAWRVSSGELLRVADVPDDAVVALGDLRE